MSKSYKRGTALREVSVTMNNGEVFVLLGHNGAGKSTLINVLTGLTDATYGEAYFRGYSFSTDMAQIQAVCGICPQFDALWDELNAEEHLYVCAAMQGLHGKYAAEEIKRVLAAVDLSEEGKNMTTTFSGGMKRRLSVCMSVLGDRRKLIFLDEPTTGVDTINKKRIWELIEKVKEEKIVVLTTHNMEEADALGDKIAILHQGTLKAVGSSLFLKNRYSNGYTLTVVMQKDDHESSETIASLIKRAAPDATLVYS
ncbi:ATP-binding cassette transporter [Selaginella moellendorffii]|uniref:ATP-binding cassette transporter n=1 Tax=Selaginella moellendorffii TaxID=88036 RepID=D8RT28_SELML|nr:ATP-binding cassette transporter [Selaginella moellendorffii]